MDAREVTHVPKRCRRCTMLASNALSAGAPPSCSHLHRRFQGLCFRTLGSCLRTEAASRACARLQLVFLRRDGTKGANCLQIWPS